jgi:hypothetical protein
LTLSVAQEAGATTSWTLCANENSTCALSSVVPKSYGVVLRYGAGTRWTYRITDVQDIVCKYDRFNVDPSSGQVCEYAVLPVKSTTFGSWTQRIACNGCSGSTFTVQWGTERNTTRTDAAEWSQTVTKSVEGGFSLYGASATVSASIASTYTENASFSNALTSSYGESISVTCGNGTSQNLRLYQFRTVTTADTLSSGSYSGDTFTIETFCAVNPPVGYTGPKCLLDYCNDALCTTCSY